jgi:hypothetical protein
MREARLTGYILGWGLAWLAAALARVGDPMQAARLFGSAEAQLQRAGVRLMPFDLPAHDGAKRAVRAQLGHDDFGRAFNEGHAMEMADVFANALGERA